MTRNVKGCLEEKWVSSNSLNVFFAVRPERKCFETEYGKVRKSGCLGGRVAWAGHGAFLLGADDKFRMIGFWKQQEVSVHFAGTILTGRDSVSRAIREQQKQRPG